MNGATAMEGHGKAGQRRSHRWLGEGREVGSRRTKHGDECSEGGFGVGVVAARATAAAA